MLCFARLVFGVSASPFLLNVTIHQHMKTYSKLDQLFVDKFLSSMLMTLCLGQLTWNLRTHSTSTQMRLVVAGFRLRKFITNSDELRHHMQENESMTEEVKLRPEDGGAGETAHTEEDQSYAKSSLAGKVDKKCGVQCTWS